MIGGGITGAGVALDAASRGYSVALLERDDYAFGTSSRSSKMVHGGLRYLQNFDLGLVREALLERQLMVQLAPHLVYPTPFLVPALGEERRDRKIGIGLNMYDVMATTRVGRSRREKRSSRDGEEDFFWSPERHRTIEGEEVAEMVPALAGRDPTAAYLFYDCQTDDSRLVLTILGEAERYGAVMLNGAGRHRGARARRARRRGCLHRGGERRADRGRGGERRQRDRRLGRSAAAGGGRRGGGRAAGSPPAAAPTSSSTASVCRWARPPASSRPARAGRSSPCPGTGGPWSGTTDNDYDGDIAHPKPAQDDIAYLLEAINAFFATSLTDSDISGAYAGVRPLISTGDPRKSVDISRKAELYETSSGMLTITGGKLTTWRRMAKQTVDRLVEREGREAPCSTAEIPLGMEAGPEDLEAPPGVGEEAVRQLAFRYGHAARDVLALAREQPAPGRADRRRATGPAGRGGDRRPARAGPRSRRRDPAPHPPRPARRLAAARCGLGAGGGRGDGGGARLVESRIAAEAEAWPPVAAEEGIDPGEGARDRVQADAGPRHRRERVPRGRGLPAS